MASLRNVGILIDFLPDGGNVTAVQVPGGWNKFKWGAIYGAAGGLGAVLVNTLPQIHSDIPLLQAAISIGATALVAGLAKGLKYLAGKAA